MNVCMFVSSIVLIGLIVKLNILGIKHISVLLTFSFLSFPFNQTESQQSMAGYTSI